jgi:hypothetical protein
MEMSLFKCFIVQDLYFAKFWMICILIWMILLWVNLIAKFHVYYTSFLLKAILHHRGYKQGCEKSCLLFLNVPRLPTEGYCSSDVCKYWNGVNVGTVCLLDDLVMGRCCQNFAKNLDDRICRIYMSVIEAFSASTETETCC